MLRDDYLIQLIRRAADAIARALGLLGAERLEEAETEAKEALRQMAKLPADTIVLLDTPTLKSVIAAGDPHALRVVARALYVLGEVEQQQNREKRARQRFVRAMEIFAAVGLGEDEQDARIARALAARFQGPQGDKS